MIRRHQVLKRALLLLSLVFGSLKFYWWLLAPIAFEASTLVAAMAMLRRRAVNDARPTRDVSPVVALIAFGSIIAVHLSAFAIGRTARWALDMLLAHGAPG